MGSLPFSDLALEGSSGIVLSAEHIIDVAKEVVHSSPLICDWEHCGTELNSWKTLQEVWASCSVVWRGCGGGENPIFASHFCACASGKNAKLGQLSFFLGLLACPSEIGELMWAISMDKLCLSDYGQPYVVAATSSSISHFCVAYALCFARYAVRILTLFANHHFLCSPASPPAL